MARRVELDHREAEEALRMLTALSAILHAPPLPERLFETLEPAIGSEQVRYDNPLGVTFLRERVEELRAVLISRMGDGLINERLRERPPRTDLTDPALD